MAGPAIGVNLNLDPGILGEAFLEQETSRPEFVHPGRMTWGPGNQEDSFVGGAG